MADAMALPAELLAKLEPQPLYSAASQGRHRQKSALKNRDPHERSTNHAKKGNQAKLDWPKVSIGKKFRAREEKLKC